MFFILSKVLLFVIYPLTWISLFLLLALVWKKRRKQFLIASFGLLYFFSNSFIQDEAVRAYEVKAIPDTDVQKKSTAIVLGGFSHYMKGVERMQFDAGADRFVHAYHLYQTGKVKKLIISGGSGKISEPEERESIFARNYLLELGVPKRDILIDSQSKNTRENAAFTKQLIDSTKTKGPFLLITSGYHLPRATACFDKVGIPTQAYAVTLYSGPRKFDLDHILVPSAGALNLWFYFIKEWVGYATYK